MRFSAYLLVFLLWASVASASLYGYPKEKKPAISLVEACGIAAAMLKLRGEESQYHIYGVTIFGDKAQSGDGAWNIRLSDEEGNEVWAYIPLRKESCSLTYYAHDYAEKGGKRREIQFKREGTKVTASEKEQKEGK